jgi:hypothetical protein
MLNAALDASAIATSTTPAQHKALSRARFMRAGP